MHFQVDDIAKVVLFPVSRASDYLYGEMIVMDGGYLLSRGPGESICAMDPIIMSPSTASIHTGTIRSGTSVDGKMTGR